MRRLEFHISKVSEVMCWQYFKASPKPLYQIDGLNAEGCACRKASSFKPLNIRSVTLENSIPVCVSTLLVEVV